MLGFGTTFVMDLHEYIKSLRLMLSLQPGRLYPGHGPVITEGALLLQVSTRILGRHTAPFTTLPYSLPRPAWLHPNILVLTRKSLLQRYIEHRETCFGPQRIASRCFGPQQSPDRACPCRRHR